MPRRMRVIAGRIKGRRLLAGTGQAVRPTADKVKGALFNILASRFDLQSAQVLDLFAGTGSLGIEALSRGAGHVVFVDDNVAAMHIVRENLHTCGMQAAARLLVMPVPRALAQLARQQIAFDGVLLDPPYGHGLVDQTLGTLAAHGLVSAG